MDDGFIEAWAAHHHLRIIDNSTDFEGKMNRLIREISYVLGEEAPYRTKRSFVVAYPDIAQLEAMPGCERVEISQVYLRSDPDTEVRVRKIGSKGWNTFYLTEKRIEGDRKRLVRRQRLTLREYENILGQADPSRHPLQKTRYCVPFDGQCFEVDVFPCWDDQALAQIELTSKDVEVRFPPELKVLREVTDEPAYRSAALAAAPFGATH